MTAPALGGVCPCCGVSVLNAFSVATWKGMDVCVWCRDDLASDDAATARKLIARLPLERES